MNIAMLVDLAAGDIGALVITLAYVGSQYKSTRLWIYLLT